LALIELTIVPIGTATTSLSRYVVAVHQVLEQAPEPIKYQMTSMSTILEGELDDLFAVIRRMHEASFQQGVQRVTTAIKIDDRRDKKATMASKLAAVSDKLQSNNKLQNIE
jgi:uncharacterized protein (TIGR00106 family)